MKNNRSYLKQALLGLTSLMLIPAIAEVSPWKKEDGDWITISGKVTKSGPHSFKLDYGKGAITIEMDDYDWAAEGFVISENDRVVVTGRVDADADQARSIEAGSVYVKNLKRSFFANSDDEEEVSQIVREMKKAKVATIAVNGKITVIKGTEMLIENSMQIISVETGTLPENAFDKSGKIQLEMGDRVTVYGAVTDGFFEASNIKATAVIEK